MAPKRIINIPRALCTPWIKEPNKAVESIPHMKYAVINTMIKLNVIPFLADILNRTKNKNGNIIGKNDTSKFILSTSIENIQYK